MDMQDGDFLWKQWSQYKRWDQNKIQSQFYWITKFNFVSGYFLSRIVTTSEFQEYLFILIICTLILLLWG